MHAGYGIGETPTGTVSVKGGCLDGLTKEMFEGATHIWTKRAIVSIPEGVETFEEEPPDEPTRESERP